MSKEIITRENYIELNNLVAELTTEVENYKTELEALEEKYIETTNVRDKLLDDYNSAKETIKQLVDENDELTKSNRMYRQMQDSYYLYRRMLNCIMSQFEGRDGW